MVEHEALHLHPDAQLRVALFPDTFHEANGVATLSRHLAEFARSRELPFLVVRAGSETRFTRDGSLETLELERGPAAFSLDKGLYCDPLLTRYRGLVSEHLLRFRPDLLHITGPGDLGFLGLLVSHNLRIPLVASWHTNLHEYLSRRLNRLFHLAPRKFRQRVADAVEQQSLRGFLRFYRTAQFTLAPNQSTVEMLHASTRRPAFLMPHGVDLQHYRPSRERSHEGRPFCIGYVGRLTAEKNVSFFVELERQLLAAGESNFNFLIVGEGGRQKWLKKHLRQAELPGLLRGDDLARAYRRMDAFVFPSLTDTFGLVLLEAMASGVPVIVAPDTGKRVGIEDRVSGLLSQDFAQSVRDLMHDRDLHDTIGNAGRRLASASSWNFVFEKLYEIYTVGLEVQDTRRELREARV